MGRPGTDFVVGDVELRFGDVYIRAEPGSHTTIAVMDKPKRALSVETVAVGGKPAPWMSATSSDEAPRSAPP